MKKIINWVLNILIIIVLIALAYLLYENYQMKQLEKDNTTVATEKFEELVCTDNTINESIENELVTNEDTTSNEIIGYISFPSLDVKSAILQGDLNDSQTEAMNRGVSHDPRSTMPGEDGNTVLAGHRELFFKNFLDLNVGDDVVINIGDNVFVYKITDYEVIDPTEVDKVFYDNDDDTLIMYTCFPIEAWKPFNQRIAVTAERVDSTGELECE